MEAQNARYTPTISFTEGNQGCIRCKVVQLHSCTSDCASSLPLRDASCYNIKDVTQSQSLPLHLRCIVHCAKLPSANDIGVAFNSKRAACGGVSQRCGHYNAPAVNQVVGVVQPNCKRGVKHMFPMTLHSLGLKRLCTFSPHFFASTMHEFVFAPPASHDIWEFLYTAGVVSLMHVHRRVCIENAQQGTAGAKTDLYTEGFALKNWRSSHMHLMHLMHLRCKGAKVQRCEAGV